MVRNFLATVNCRERTGALPELSEAPRTSP